MTIDTTPTALHDYDSRDKKGRKLALIYQCREKWENLQATENDLVRYCTNCSQPVFHVTDVNDVHLAAAAGRCVMVKPKDGGPYLGMAVTQHDDKTSLNWD